MNKCEYCHETLNGLPIICHKCGKHFCSAHKFPEDHECVNRDKKEEKDHGLVEHDKREAKHDHFINEEITIIKRRLHKNNMYKSFFEFLWDHKLSVIFLVLLLSAFYLQSNDIYDVKGKAEDLLIKFKIGEGFLKTDEPLLENLTEYEKIEEGAVIVEEDDSRSMIAKIQDATSIYYSSEVKVVGYIEWREIEIGNKKFEQIIIDDNGKFLPFIFEVQNVGFNKYSKYEITGIVRKEKDSPYIEAKIIDKVVNR